MVDELASEYGWWKDDILDKTYFDELFYLLKAKKYRNIDDWQMQLAIVSNPHTKDPQALINELKSQGRPQIIPGEWNQTEFDRLKQTMTGRLKIQGNEVK